MKFGREKCAMLIMRRGKRHMTEGIEIQNQEKIRTKYFLRILGNIGNGYQTMGDERKKYISRR